VADTGAGAASTAVVAEDFTAAAGAFMQAEAVDSEAAVEASLPAADRSVAATPDRSEVVDSATKDIEVAAAFRRVALAANRMAREATHPADLAATPIVAVMAPMDDLTRASLAEVDLATRAAGDSPTQAVSPVLAMRSLTANGTPSATLAV